MEQLIIVKTLQQLAQLKAYIEANDYIAFDVETTGVRKDSKVVGYSISADAETAYYVVLSYWDVPQQSIINTTIYDEAVELLKLLQGKNLIAHNGVFDCSMIKNNFNIDLIAYLHTDTLVLAHLLDENRLNGLKELGASFFGESAKAEQIAMKESVVKNGGKLTKDTYELYKADADLLGYYGAKDAILTIKLFYILVEQLYAEGLDKFFYEDESMPLLRGPTYDLNTVGLKIDLDKLEKVRGTLEAECLEAQSFIAKETEIHTKDQFKTFNPNSGDQLAWLLYFKLGNLFHKLTDTGQDICKFLNVKPPYSNAAKREFLKACQDNKDVIYQDGALNPKTGKMSKPKRIGFAWKYLSTDAESLETLKHKHKWVEKLLELNKNKKILSTYVDGIKEKVQYGIVHPSFLQTGTSSGRYSSRDPNFQNLPRKDKRVKSFVVSRPNKVFVGADYAQLEPRVFAAMSGDETLMASFASGEDFYSVIGAPIFHKTGYSLIKDAENSFASKFPDLRDKAKVLALATPYGRTASFTASQMKVKRDEAQEMMDNYFRAYPKVELMMLSAHEEAKSKGAVYSLYARPRRIPEAKLIAKHYGTSSHSELPYAARTLLNLAMNHKIQSTAASIVNRSAIAFWNYCMELAKSDTKWHNVKIVLQVHDEIVVEAPESLAEDVKVLLKHCMENTAPLPGVDLIANPVVAYDLASLK